MMYPTADQICRDRVVIVTGAGRGIGREYALEFARHGAAVVVNDFGGERDGGGNVSEGPAQAVVDEIVAFGGRAAANFGDVADPDDADAMVAQAVDTFGQLDVLVNNAGILRDRMLANMSIEEWDSVIRVHLRGTFCPSRAAAQHWRERSKAIDGPVGARLINTASSSGIYGNVGQANYAAAKAGIASLTIVASQELSRYGVTANALYPTALSRLTEDVFERAGMIADPADEFDPLDPANIAPAVVWLGSEASESVTGRVFGLRGGRIVIAEGWAAGPTFDSGRRLEAAEAGEVILNLLQDARPNAGMDGLIPEKSNA